MPLSHDRIKLWNNEAKLAGNSVFGGHIENCTLPGTYNHVSGIQAFPILFEIPWNNSLTEVTSQIHRLCFCYNGLPDCGPRQWQETIFPGQEITISGVALGQLGGTVPSVVLSEIAQSDSVATLGNQQDVQQLSVICGDLHYQIRAREESTLQINLQSSFERQQKPTQSLRNVLKVYVNVTNCPIGFVQGEEHYKEGCACITFLREREVVCHISDLSFELIPPLWIGYQNSNGLILAHDSCPLD